MNAIGPVIKAAGALMEPGAGDGPGAPEEGRVEILVVEDSATQAQYLAQILEQAGYRVRLAGNGREGLAAARANPPTLIVSDIAMPEMDGFALCQEVKRDALLRDIPVILLTSLSSLYDVIKGLDSGADNFLRKPYDSAYLLGRIRYILANRALRASERVQMGMRINLGGQTHFITAERQQIFDLLISTYEEAIQMTEQLKAQQVRITSSYQSLEGLYRIAEALNPALTEQAVGELALERLLDFPGVVGASLKLVDADGSLRLVAVRDVDDGLGPGQDGAALDGDGPRCDCERRLMRAEPRRPETILSCAERGHPHACIPLDTGGGTRGVLCLKTTERRLDEEQFQLLATVGSQIGVAVERARLYETMETRVRERTAAWQGERQLLSAVVNTSGALVCMVDGEGLIRLFNPACEAALGWRAEEAIGRPCGEVLREDHGEAGGLDAGGLARLCSNPPANDGPVQLRGQWRSRDGTLRAIIWSATWFRREDGAVEYFVCTGVDVTELRGAEEKLRYMSRFDALTGLPNRLVMRDRVRQLQEQDGVTEGRQQVGLLLIKPERLRVIAESLGLEAEQSMLRQAAGRLAHRQRGGVSVGRVSERTFAIAMLGRGPEDFAGMARQVLAELSLPFLLGEQELYLDPAIGIALGPNDGDDYDAIYRGADAALRRALSSKSERYEFYRPALNQDAHARFQFENALRGAIERHELVLHYQVQTSIATGAIIGVESLVRWQHPEQGLIGPGTFIPLAEETGMILAIGEWVLRCACEQAMAWQREGLPPVPVSVNLSARQFSEHAVGMVERILAETGLAPRLLELELTESASMEEPEKTIEILRQIKAMGVKVAIDDFGTGYSNLSYLKRFPLDKLKLDQSFVRDIVTGQHDLSIARAVIAMGHSLGLTVIAEGVEGAEQLDLLAANGCDEIQGYYLSRPVDGAACAAVMRTHQPDKFRR